METGKQQLTGCIHTSMVLPRPFWNRLKRQKPGSIRQNSRQNLHLPPYAGSSMLNALTTHLRRVTAQRQRLYIAQHLGALCFIVV